MRYNRLRRMLVEDKLDDLLLKYPILGEYKYELRGVYNMLEVGIRAHNKFGKFFEWCLRDIDNFEYFDTPSKLTELFKNYLKYNLKLEDYKSVVDMVNYIANKENEAKLVIDPKLAEKVFEDGEKIVIMPLNFEGSVKYGSSTWCIQKNIGNWYDYISNGKLSYFVIYKSGRIVEIRPFTGLNWSISNIQVDLNGKIYITNAENTVRTGKVNAEADIILKYMGLTREMFKSFKDKEVLKKMLDADKNLVNNLSGYLYSLINTEYPELLKGINNIKRWFNAIIQGEIDVIKEILADKDFDVNVKEGGQSGFIKAVYNNRYDIVKLLISDSRVDINSQEDDGWTALMYCCRDRKEQICKILLSDPRLDVNIQKEDEWTALHLACYNNHEDIVKILLDDGRIDINLKNDDADTAYQVIRSTHIRQIMNNYMRDKKK